MINVLLINSPSGPNFPGLVEVNIALADQVVSIPDVDENHELVSDLVLMSGATMYRFFCPHLDASYESNSKDSDEGEYYEHSVSFPFPLLDEKLQQLNRKFKGRDLILIIKDLNKMSWLIGTKDFPLRRKSKISTGGDSGANGYKFEFEGSTPEPALSFTGSFDLIDEDDATPTTLLEFNELEFDELEFL